MTTAMRAAFTLTLEDKLSSGLENIKKSFDALVNVGNKLTLGKLERGGDLLRTVTQEVKNLTSNLRSIEGVADRAWASMKRMGSAGMNWTRNTFGKSSRIGAFQGAAAGYSVYAPLESAAELSNTLRHSAITAHQYGPDADRMMASQRALYTSTALATGQSSHKIAESGFWMALTGMSADLVSALTPMAAKIATAYNADVSDASKTAFGLNYSMGIGKDDMERALGMLALFGKHGHFLFADQAKSMPGIAAAAQMSHMTGMGALEEIGAAMQISMKVVDPAQPAMAATNLEQFLRQIQRSRDDKTFSKYGVDLGGVLMDAAGKGISPMEAALGKIKQIQDREALKHHITDPNKRAQSDTAILNHLFTSAEAATFASAMLHNLKEYEELKKFGHNVSTSMIDKDFNESMRDLSSQMKLFHEETTQLVDRLGFGFEPVLHLINAGLLVLIHSLDWLDKRMPGLGSGVLATAGGLLVLVGVLGIVGAALPAVLTGLELLATVIGAIAGSALFPLAGFALIGYEIYSNWADVEPVVRRVGDAIGTFAEGAIGKMRSWMMDGLWAVSDAWDAMSAKIMANDTVIAALGLLSGAWGAIKMAAGAAFDAMDKITGGALSVALGGIRDIVQEIAQAFKDIAGAIDKFADATGFNKALINPTPIPDGDVGPGGGDTRLGATPIVEFLIHLADGLKGEVVKTHPSVKVTTPDPGRTTNRQ